MQNKQSTDVADSRWRVALRAFFGELWVEIAVGLLVLFSVCLTLVEIGMMTDPTSDLRTLLWIEVVNDFVTAIFIVELTLRYFAARSKKAYLREFWLDILATVPLFRVFGRFPALRFLRLVRIFRLLGIFSRLKTHYPHVFRRGAWDFLVICGLLVVAVLFGTMSMMYFEHRAVANDPDQPALTLEHSFWHSLYTLFSGEPFPGPPRTLPGRITAVIMMFMGLTIFAIFAGTVSAFMVDRIRVEGRVANFDELSDHVVVCGWSNKAEIILREYRASKAYKKTPIVVITEVEVESMGLPPALRPNLYFICDDFTRVSALRRAGIERAARCVIISDISRTRSEQDADARTILAALTVEKINRDVFTCAELIDRDYASHLEMGHVNEYVVSGEYSAYMLAQSSMNRGLVGVFGELLTSQHGNEFFRFPIPDNWQGRSFSELMVHLKKEDDAILVAVFSHAGQLHVNPSEYEFQSGDEAVAISRGPVSLS